jgi:hypothetical protein
VIEEVGAQKGPADGWIGKNQEERVKHAESILLDLEGKSPGLGRWLERSAQVQENLSLREHSLSVLVQFGLLWPFHCKRFPEDEEKTAWMEALLVLHDLGKALGDKKFQHATTPLMLPLHMSRWGFSEPEIKDAKLMTRHDWVGQTLKGHLPIEPALVALTQLAASSTMGLARFLRLQWIYYVSDSSSYPCLRARLFSPHPILGLSMPSAQALTERLLGVSQA